MIAAIIGIGLIGGSFALSLKDNNLVKKILGVDSNINNSNEALRLGLVDEIVTLEQAAEQANFIVVTTPVNYIPTVVIKLLNRINEKCIVIDMGSTKSELCDMISQHPNRGRFVATHPMWGTEYSGPKAALHNAFKGSTVVLCEKDKSNQDAINFVENIYKSIGMNVTYMNAEDHDIHTAYISHISHLTSFALSLTVLEKELEEDHITVLAGGGFDSTVRLAKSSPEMWLPIFMQNKYNVLDVLREHIHQLQILRKLIEKDDTDGLKKAMQKANEIRRIIK
ncbi:MAG: prephenate dehydrogenase [Rikenellaceae bacterium]